MEVRRVQGEQAIRLGLLGSTRDEAVVDGAARQLQVPPPLQKGLIAYRIEGYDLGAGGDILVDQALGSGGQRWARCGAP